MRPTRDNPRTRTIYNMEGDRSIRVVECCDPADFELRCEEAQLELDAEDGVDWSSNNGERWW